MANKTPRDTNNDSFFFDFDQKPEDGLPEEEQSFSFDEDYLTPDADRSRDRREDRGQEQDAVFLNQEDGGNDWLAALQDDEDIGRSRGEEFIANLKAAGSVIGSGLKRGVRNLAAAKKARQEARLARAEEEAEEYPEEQEPEKYPEERELTVSSRPGKPTRSQKRAARKARNNALANADQLTREAPTVGRNLRGDQMLVYDSELDEIDYTDDEDLPEFRDYMPIRFRRYGRIGIGGGLMYGLFVISVSIILACVSWMFASDVLALNKEAKNAIVVIEAYEPTGDMPTVEVIHDQEVPIQVDIDQVATALKNGGIIQYKWLFKLFSQFSHANTKIDPGTYSVSTELDYRALVTNMQFGSENQEKTTVTFPEGWSMAQIFQLLEESNVCQEKDLYEAAANYDFDYDFLADLELGDAKRLEGYLFPDTYEFYQGEAAPVTISRFLNNTKNRLTEEMYEQAEALGMTMREILIMASLIEKEAGAAEGERENMASVLYNRLGVGMKLQLDSTVNYVKGTSTLDLSIEDTEIDDPYNTYVYEGLPPGPICNPGLASIQAALEPASTNYWYWYSVDGVSSFFTSYDEQQAFARSH